MLNLAKKKKE